MGGDPPSKRGVPIQVETLGVSVVVATSHGASIERVVESLFDCTPLPDDVVVAGNGNGCPNGLAKALLRAPASVSVRYVELRGSAAARRRAAAALGSQEVVVVLDESTSVAPRFVAHIRRTYADDEVGAAASVVEAPWIADGSTSFASARRGLTELIDFELCGRPEPSRREL